MDIDALIEEAEATGVDEMALEDWVRDIASELVADEALDDEDEESVQHAPDLLGEQLASEVNGRGLRAQIEFLAHHGVGEDELREYLELN
ncbi:MAG TPA: hypothetical protein VFA48_01195 [Gammaproteobacteria bacterium]|nr:hypothetical protein [Gammaproteobacteria bacterium]